MRNWIVCGLAALLTGVMAAAPAGATPAAGALVDAPKAANASRAPEKRAEKHPKPRKTKKATRSGGAASAPP